ncbi:hypothetical protein BC940DRAFT_293614 [Gongronella butleri]|nr:hypothetical protein BC940DRAFT_293614 [Gongronella butleri]
MRRVTMVIPDPPTSPLFFLFLLLALDVFGFVSHCPGIMQVHLFFSKRNTLLQKQTHPSLGKQGDGKGGRADDCSKAAQQLKISSTQ